ncbi:MAG: superoxide dismutase family protein [Undibacterium sp.]|nr:superoxide dismutase family protein [Undibacterium sp.]
MKKWTMALALACLSATAVADNSLKVAMNLVGDSGVLVAIGSVNVTESQYGLIFTPTLSGLPAGLHGFHVHENPSCEPKEKDGKKTPALAAGGHYDPLKSGHHGSPWGDGHLGDLPALFVDADGKANQAVLAPRLKLSDLTGRALMIHVGGDNHADHPAILGGGGARMACGVMP